MTATTAHFNISKQGWGVVKRPSRRIATPHVKRVAPPARGVGESADFLFRLAAYIWHESTEAPDSLPREVDGPTWLGTLYSHVANEETQSAVDLLFDEIDDLLIGGGFSDIDQILSVVDPKRLDVHLMVSVLSVTLPAASQLSERADLLQRIERQLEEVASDRVERLLDGLR